MIFGVISILKGLMNAKAIIYTHPPPFSYGVLPHAPINTQYYMCMERCPIPSLNIGFFCHHYPCSILIKSALFGVQFLQKIFHCNTTIYAKSASTKSTFFALYICSPWINVSGLDRFNSYKDVPKASQSVALLFKTVE